MAWYHRGGRVRRCPSSSDTVETDINGKEANHPVLKCHHHEISPAVAKTIHANILITWIIMKSPGV